MIDASSGWIDSFFCHEKVHTTLTQRKSTNNTLQKHKRKQEITISIKESSVNG